MSEELDRFIANNRDELIESQKAYISRLEKAYLKSEAEYIWQNSDPGYDFDKCEEMARESLERIKRGDAT